MKTFLKGILIVCLVLAALAGIIWQGSFADRADAATANPGPTLSGYQVIVIPISAVSTTTTAIAKFNVPWPVRVVSFSQVANSTTGVVTLDLVNASGTSLLSLASTVSTTANLVTDATLTTTSSTLNVTDETALQINTAGTGTAANATVTIGVKRL